MATIDSMNKDTTRLSDGPDWTFDLLDVYLAEIDRVAKLYRLDTYPHQIEVITSEQMMDAYSSVGMWICPYISRHLLSLNPLLACCRRYSRG
ncbi:SpoVR family protein, partial [Escherichia coli]|uniref:SpoVR family protein n=1 Tax=Escherichia coli TaxID=562 RepID=UPI001FCE957C